MKSLRPPAMSTISRIITHCLLIAAIAAGSALPASAANLILNGDFSGGTSGTFAPGSATGGNTVPTDWTGYATGDGSLMVVSDKVNYNGSNQDTGSYIEQSVTTAANRWYVLDWQQTSHTGGDSDGVMVTSTLTSGAASTTNSYRGSSSPQTLIHTAGISTTVRLSDVGASTVSLDTRIVNVGFDLANGQYNMAHLAGLSSDTQFNLPWGNEENAVDGRVQNSSNNSNTVFHGGNDSGSWFEMDFTSNYANAYIDRIEIEARPGFNSRKGDTIEIFSTSGALLETIDISSDTTSSYGVDGSWRDIGKIRITEDGQFLNVAEVRAFSSFVDGVAVPEPASTSLLALGCITLLLRRRK